MKVSHDFPTINRSRNLKQSTGNETFDLNYLGMACYFVGKI